MNCILDASSASVKAHCYVFHLLFLKFYFFLCPTEQLKGVGNYMLNIQKFFVFAFNGKLLLPFIFDSLGSEFGNNAFAGQKGKKRYVSRRYFPLSFFIPSFKNFQRQRHTNFHQFEVSLFYIVNSRLGYTVGTDSEKY